MSETTTKTANKATAKPAVLAREIPFNRLFRSEKNVRKTDPAAGIEELAASIKSRGQLQNLVVEKVGNKFGVVAGGRRYQAFALLVERGDLPKTTPVLCREVTADDAHEASLAENVLQIAMHPADQFSAFAQMIDTGLSVEEVANRFGTTVSIVNKRLKLARVSPSVMTAFREDKLSLDMVMAFTITDNHDDQDALLQWIDSLSYTPAPEAIRSRLLPDQKIRSDAPLVKFVTLEAYQAAGGHIAADLFSASSYLLDMPLLHKLAEEKLARLEAEILADGWSWVELAETMPNWAQYAPRIYPEDTPFTPEAQAESDALTARYEELQAIAEQSDLTDAQEGELENIEQAQDLLTEQFQKYTDKQKAEAGVIILTGTYDIGSVRYGIIKRASQKTKKNANAEAGEDANGTPAPASFPAGLREELYRVRTSAFQAALSADPVMILRVLVFSVLSASYKAVIPATIQTALPPTEKNEGSKSLAAVRAFVTSAQNPLGMPQQDKLWPWLLTKEESELVVLLASAVISGVTASNQNWIAAADRLDAAGSIAQTIGLNVLDWWKPDAENLFSSLPKALIADFMQEMGGAPEDWEKMKRSDLATVAAQKAAETGWLPDFMRTPAVSVPVENSEAA